MMLVKPVRRDVADEESGGGLQQGVARALLVALWLAIAASPLLLVMAATMLLGGSPWVTRHCCATGSRCCWSAG